MKVFISHSSKDKMFVRTLKEGLQANSIGTWIDEDELEYGDSLISKLETGLDESSHLVIVLSPTSVNSEWVKYELKKAISNYRTGLMNKIIPIKYRECVIPDELADLLHADLSNEVVLPEGNGVKFISNGYPSFFLKLVRAIQNASKSINKKEKEEIISSLRSSEKDIEHSKQLYYRGNVKIIGFSSDESLVKYQKLIAKKLKKENLTFSFRPILLPHSTKNYFKPNIGDKIFFEEELISDSFGHFAGYRLDDLAITLDKRVRDELVIEVHSFYQIEINPDENMIVFANEIITDANKV